METTLNPPLAHNRPPAVRFTIFGIAMILFMVNLDTSIVVVGLPVLVKTLHASFATAQWMVLSYMLALTALIAGAGRLGDIFGKKNLYLLGITIFTLASLACGFASNSFILIAFRAIQGIGAAFCISLSFAIAGDMVPKTEIGRVMGILTTMIPLGIASGPTIGGLLLSSFGWPSMFFVNIPIGVIAYWLISKFTHSTKPARIVKVDIIGMLLLAVVLCCYALGMTYMESKGFAHPLVVSLLVGAIASLVIFIWYEGHIEHPFLKISLFRNGILSVSLLASVLVYIVITSTIVLFPFYLTKACGFKPLQVGLVMSFGPLVTALLSFKAGKIADKYGARKVMLYGIMIMTAGCWAMSYVTPEQGIFGFLWRIAIIQVGLTFFQTPNNAAVMELASPDQRGLLSGLLSLSRSTGQITGTAVLGAIFAIMVSHTAGSDTANANGTAVTYGIEQVFTIATCLIGVAALLLYYVLRKNNKVALNHK
ncbi:MAG: transporter [Mucilaginibacter sp.]|nr:transporter [Mucilaginibacter sp.]